VDDPAGDLECESIPELRSSAGAARSAPAARAPRPLPAVGVIGRYDEPSRGTQGTAPAAVGGGRLVPPGELVRPGAGLCPRIPARLLLPPPLQTTSADRSQRRRPGLLNVGLPELVVCTVVAAALESFPHFWPLSETELPAFEARITIRWALGILETDADLRGLRQALQPSGLPRPLGEHTVVLFTMNAYTGAWASALPRRVAKAGSTRWWYSRTPRSRRTCATIRRCRRAFDDRRRERVSGEGLLPPHQPAVGGHSDAGGRGLGAPDLGPCH
jgi:hypothetical protein